MPSPAMDSPTPKPLRVGFDVTSATSHRSRGIASYIRALLPALEIAAPWVDPILFLRNERWLRKEALAALLPGAERRWILDPLKVPLGDLDVYHGMGTHLPRGNRTVRSFTLHDLRSFDLDGAAPEESGRRVKTIRRADRILCISEYGRDRLLHHVPDLSAPHIEVIHHGVDHKRFRPRDGAECEAALAGAGIKAPFLLQLGSFFPHKNLELAIESFARSRARKEGVHLVFIGGGSKDHSAQLKRRCDELCLSDQVLWVDSLDAPAVPLVLAAAEALLFPSRYEGFGLPILEAMASGVPGVSSNCACLPEIVGDAWPTCSPDDPDMFSAALDRTLFDAEQRTEQIRLGLARASAFTWERCATRTAEFLAAASRLS
ncbi:MAG TPA: glycosyltransferase family 1 protein [Planctomycetes bacterium]|nr:glycosyltransferase family 1 protein [Planctomycetota bacterium]HIK62268.1 glycosyltransferase family 1 protein [Planctomycetota bacterium]